MTAYTPTTPNVKRAYATGKAMNGVWGYQEADEQFDRWLADLKREWQAEALEAAEQVALKTLTAHGLVSPEETDYAADSRALLIAGRLRNRAAEVRGTDERNG